MRDLLLSVAEREIYAPHWTEQILDEMARNIVADRRSTPEKVERMRTQMNLAFPDALITGYEGLELSMTNHPKDRHVLAAAVRGRTGLIVTENVGDFPPSACEPYDIDIQTSDEFLSYALDHDQPAVLGAFHLMATKRRHPPTTPDELLDHLEVRLPTFTSQLRPVLHAITGGP